MVAVVVTVFPSTDFSLLPIVENQIESESLNSLSFFEHQLSSLPLQELLLLSPASPLRRSRTRLADRIEMDDEVVVVLDGGAKAELPRWANFFLELSANVFVLKEQKDQLKEKEMKKNKLPFIVNILFLFFYV
ncbi:hypothetical protein COLO4_36190 [Corchorus olitorius]|uniref:Uncharacterized protein n=1 Tax=Corchorus olitorius TaxID=93759 RepID=A0A1R3GAJ6_9ROSI|nr:hypothetical protein COLO4_36190 [Corchorus olitorius]